ncbi:MAG: hypothetical protein IJN43_16185 [Ruminococcus sp.]|nr:hypothetical protein [Oscillospiraceae bacterium]MBQ6945838.1 hypothetical protein [Ruminococcus sp.]
MSKWKPQCLQRPVFANNFERWRFYIYFVVITVMIFLVCGMPVFASLGDFEIQDLYLGITDNVAETNDLLEKALEFSQTSPYDVVNSISSTTQGTIAKSIRTASQTMALVVATLLLMVDFFRKTTNFEWASKWEHLLIFLVKIIVIKQVVQNADTIVGYVYAGFQTINAAATNNATDFLPCGNITVYSMSYPYRGDSILEWAYSQIWHVDLPYNYEISQDAVKMFYPNATFPAAGEYAADSYPFTVPVESANFTPLIEYILLQPYFLIMKAIAVVVFVISIGRVFELAVYTIFAPLPLATFASDVSSDVAKNFIKNYIATVLQIAVIVVMFIVYVALNNYFDADTAWSTKLLHLIELLALGLGVIKSGSWAKKVCGMG